MNKPTSENQPAHRPRIDEDARVTLSSTRVALPTLTRMIQWQNVARIRQGILTDRMTRFCASRAFDPSQDYAETPPAKKASAPSTAPDAKTKSRSQRAS